MVQEAHAVLFATPYFRKDYLEDVVRRTMTFFANTFRHLVTFLLTPAALVQAPEPLMAAIEQFFLGEFFRRSGSKVLVWEEALPVVLHNYI